MKCKQTKMRGHDGKVYADQSAYTFRKKFERSVTSHISHTILIIIMIYATDT